MPEYMPRTAGMKRTKRSKCGYFPKGTQIPEKVPEISGIFWNCLKYRKGASGIFGQALP